MLFLAIGETLTIQSVVLLLMHLNGSHNTLNLPCAASVWGKSVEIEVIVSKAEEDGSADSPLMMLSHPL